MLCGNCIGIVLQQLMHMQQQQMHQMGILAMRKKEQEARLKECDNPSIASSAAVIDVTAGACGQCGDKGHAGKKCRGGGGGGGRRSGFAAEQKACSKCHHKGHKAKKCPLRKKSLKCFFIEE